MVRKRHKPQESYVNGRQSVYDRLADLVGEIHPGQPVYPQTLRAIFGRQSWDIDRDDVADLKAALEDQPRLEELLHSPTLQKVIYQRDDNLWARRRLHRGERDRAIVDVNNVVWTLGSGAPTVASVEIVINHLRERGVAQLIGIADANLRHTVRDRDRIQRITDAFDRFECAESGTTADQRIIVVARETPCIIVTNDNYREYRKRDSWSRANLWRILTPISWHTERAIRLSGAAEELYEKSRNQMDPALENGVDVEGDRP